MVDADPTRAAYNTVIATVLVRRFAVRVAVGAAGSAHVSNGGTGDNAVTVVSLAAPTG
ncbi:MULTISPECIES: hypothetical protein [Mycobacterium]|uniref:hypothetical protein n=1 Tax=Mycobacterium TaxID=1763 RepID=UPI0012E9ED0E|nr:MULTISPECIES: hypothetical protein [Mycobacterium]MCV7009260.1 hypothetical protein [Mycobacterium gordonae]